MGLRMRNHTKKKGRKKSTAYEKPFEPSIVFAKKNVFTCTMNVTM